MTNAKATSERLVDYLTDHVKYERDMLGYTFRAMHATPPGPNWNVVFESFGLHARNLYDFLRHEGKKTNTFRADDYVPGRPKPQALSLFNDLDAFLCHMSAGRAERAKLTLERLYSLGEWLDREWSKWVNSLPSPFNDRLDPSPVCEPVTLEHDVTPSTACTHVMIVMSGS